MAQDQQTMVVDSDAWTQITNADVTNITFQVLDGAVYIRYTTDTTQPSRHLKGAFYKAGEGETDGAVGTLVQLASADRVWARATEQARAALIYVDHA